MTFLTCPSFFFDHFVRQPLTFLIVAVTRIVGNVLVSRFFARRMTCKFCFTVQQQLLNKLVCIEHVECGACLSAAAHCRWCADPYYSTAAPRCNDDERLHIHT